MSARIIVAAALIFLMNGATVMAQSSQATSPGQSGSSNTLPQAPSGGRATGHSASGPETESEKQADSQAKKATDGVCQGC